MKASAQQMTPRISTAAARIHVAVGIIVDADSHVLLARRPGHVHQGGLWEFPGGKLEAGEGARQALVRELREELALEVTACEPLLEMNHDYGDRVVLLNVWRVLRFHGSAVGREGQALRWVPLAQLDQLALPAANAPIVAHLQWLLG